MSQTQRIESLKQMLVHEPKDEFLNYALGLEYAKQKENYVKAEQQFKFVLENNPNYIAAYYQLGQLYEAMNEKNLALQQYQLGLQCAITQKNNKAINELNEAIFLLED